MYRFFVWTGWCRQQNWGDCFFFFSFPKTNSESFLIFFFYLISSLFRKEKLSQEEQWNLSREKLNNSFPVIFFFFKFIHSRFNSRLRNESNHRKIHKLNKRKKVKTINDTLRVSSSWRFLASRKLFSNNSSAIIRIDNWFCAIVLINYTVWFIVETSFPH